MSKKNVMNSNYHCVGLVGAIAQIDADLKDITASAPFLSFTEKKKGFVRISVIFM
jgi:hypothetical protein